jgi:thioredoxin 1
MLEFRILAIPEKPRLPQPNPEHDAMAVIELNEENFESTVDGSDIVLVDFWAPWCGPCKSFAPVYDEASEKHADITFAKVNTEEQQGLAGYFNIRSIPTLMVFRDNIIIFSEAGALPATSLDMLIEQVRTLDMVEVHRQIAEAEAEGS